MDEITKEQVRISYYLFLFLRGTPKSDCVWNGLRNELYWHKSSSRVAYAHCRRNKVYTTALSLLASWLCPRAWSFSFLDTLSLSNNLTHVFPSMHVLIPIKLIFIAVIYGYVLTPSFQIAYWTYPPWCPFNLCETELVIFPAYWIGGIQGTLDEFLELIPSWSL